MQKAYDPNHPLSYGYHRCPTCGAEFYGGGRAMHRDGCKDAGSYKSCIYVYGPNENTRWVGAVVTEEEKAQAQS